MNQYKYYKTFFLGLGIALLTNCNTSKPVQTQSLKPVPASFGKNSDSTNSATIQWTKYFTDDTLIRLIDSALVNNLDLLAAKQRIEMSRAQIRYNRGLALPFISPYVAVGQRRFGQYTMDGVGNYDTQFSPNITPEEIIPEHLPDYYMGLQTSWEIDIWGKLRNKKKAAISRYLSSVEGSNWVRTSLIADVATTYYELLAQDEELKIITETRALQERELSIIILQKEAGRANELAVKQFEAQLLNSKSLEIEIKQRIVESESRLNYLLGRYPKAVKRDSVFYTQEMPSQVYTGIPSELLKNRPDVRQAEFDLMATKSSVKAARAAFYPSVNINANVGLQSFNTSFWLTPQSLAYSVFGGLMAPLINRSAIRAQFNTSRAEQVEAMYNYQRSIINGYVEVYNQMVNIENLQKIYVLKKDEVDVLTTSIATASELFLTGRATYLEVIITRKNALQSRLELIEIKKRQYNALINIYKALGGGWR